MNIILTGISTDQREFLDEMESEYCKFKGLEELPDNVYQAFYWLSRYSNLAVRKINTKEEKLKSPNTTKEATETPWPCKFSDSLVCAAKSCSDTNCDIYEPA